MSRCAVSASATVVRTPEQASNQEPGGSHVVFCARPGPMPCWPVAVLGVTTGEKRMEGPNMYCDGEEAGAWSPRHATIAPHLI